MRAGHICYVRHYKRIIAVFAAFVQAFLSQKIVSCSIEGLSISELRELLSKMSLVAVAQCWARSPLQFP